MEKAEAIEAEAPVAIPHVCPNCSFSRQWGQQMIQGGKIMLCKNPVFACMKEESSRFGVWMAPFGTCEWHEFDQERYDQIQADFDQQKHLQEELKQQKSSILVPKSTRRSLASN